MAHNKNNSISLANVIATIGIVLLTVALFLGHFYMGDNVGISIFKSVCWSLAFTFLLWFLIKAKTADEERTKWLVIELLTLAIYLVLAVLSSSKVSKFPTVYLSASEMKATANDDVFKINQVIDLFKSTERQALTNTVIGLENACNGEVSPSLEDFVTANDFELSQQSIDIFKEKWELVIDNVIDSTQTGYAEAWEAELDRCNDLIQGWSVLKIPEAVRTMSSIGEQVSAKLQEVSASLPLPVIHRTDDGIYDIEKEHETGTYPIDSQFMPSMDRVGSYSIIGIVFCVFLHAMILFNYIVAFRSKKKRPQKKDILFNDHGMTLKY